MGYKHSEETKRKISLKKVGKPSWNKGVPHSEETKLRISTRAKGRPNHKLRGRIFSDETRKKMSLASNHKGEKNPMFGKRGEKSPLFGRQYSVEHRRKIGESRSGEKSNFWRGGVTPINNKIRSSLEYRLWRDSVFKRDNYTCVWCDIKFVKGVTGDVKFQVDHIKPFSQYPELRFAIDNGRTLCLPCHKTTNTYLNRWYKKS